MWQVQEGISMQKDEWEITEVDCFTKPHGLLLDAITPGIYPAYLFYIAIAKSYGFLHGLYENIDWCFGIHQYVARQMGFDYHIHYCPNTVELKKEINIWLKKGRPVLLPGNLNAIYYAWAYQQFDAFHLFLVNGYNDNTDIYSVIDNMHNMDKLIPQFQESGKFTCFNMRASDLLLSWHKLKQLPYTYYSYKYITLEYINKESIIPTAEEQIQYFLNLQEAEWLPERHRELYSMQIILSYFEKSGKDIGKELPHFRMDNIFGNKRAMLHMAIELIKELTKSAENKELCRIKEQIESRWLKLQSIFYFRLYKKNLHNIIELKDIYQPILQYEASFMQCIKNEFIKYQNKKK